MCWRTVLLTALVTTILVSCRSGPTSQSSETDEIEPIGSRKTTERTLERARDQGEIGNKWRIDHPPPPPGAYVVISSSMKYKRAWIRLNGRTLMRGDSVRITNAYGQVRKALGEVLRLQKSHDRAELRLYSVVDRVGDPPTKGDLAFPERR